MATVTFGPGGVREYRGAAGNHVYKRHGGGTIVTRKPDMSGVIWSDAQKAGRERFAEAIAYAHVAMADPQLKAIYQEAARRRRRVAFRVAVSDFLRRPVVEEIDLSAYSGAPGDVITISATDDRQVAAVYVRLTDAAGTVLEEGAAELDWGHRWLYAARTSAGSASTVRVEATASDLPGGTHTAVKEIELDVEGARPDGRHAVPPAGDEARGRLEDLAGAAPQRIEDVAKRNENVHQDVPGRDDVESLARIRELLLQGDLRDQALSSPGDPEHVRLALDLLLRAEHLLRTSG